MQLHAVTLKFLGQDQSLEAEYLRDSFHKNLRYLRFCHVLSLLAFGSAGLLDYLLFPDQYPQAWLIRYLFASPPFVIGFLMTYTTWYQRWWQHMAFGYVLVTGTATLAIMCLMPPPNSYLYFVHTAVCFMFGFVFVRIRFLVASLAGVLLYLSFFLATTVFVRMPPAVLYNAMVIMTILLLMGMFFTYGYEYADRREFHLRRQVERERQKSDALNTMLQERIQARTEELRREMEGHSRVEHEMQALQRQLGQSQKMEVIGTLAGGIAHDFNNILASVIGYAELARLEAGMRHPLSEYVEQVLVAAGRAAELVRQILTFSRQTEQERKPILLTPLVKEIVQLMRASLPSTIAIEYTVNLDITVLADHTQMHQVLMNLCTNAWHAMRDKGGTLTIELGQERLREQRLIGGERLAPGDWVCLRIRDTGKGIPLSIVDRIFEPFFTTKEQSEGTGMGLAVVHGIIAAHEGAIAVESIPGRGTCFTLYLPAASRAAVEPGKAERVISGGTETILVVDDEASLVRVITDILTRLGYTVEGRTSSLEALELYRAAGERFDLVLTDLTMPNLCGDELARRITALRPVPIILCTGFAAVQAQETMQSYGIAAVLEKPILPWQLADTVRQTLDVREKDDSAGSSRH